MNTKENIWILTTERTGSHRLCELLNNTGYFNPFFDEYFKKIQFPKIEQYCHKDPQYWLNNYENVFNVKVHYIDLNYLNLKNLDCIVKFFPNIKFIHLYRENFIEQITSFFIAIKTNVWFIDNEIEYEKYQKAQKVNFDKNYILCLYQKMLNEKNQLKKTVEKYNSRTIHVKYENIKNQPLIELNKILKFLNKKEVKFIPESKYFIQNKKEKVVFIKQLKKLFKKDFKKDFKKI